MHFSKPAVLGAFASSVSAYSATQRTFAVNHFYGNGPLTMGRMDPIVNPGGPSGHVHAVQGGNGFALTMTDQQALDSSCTSSLVMADKSNYWSPSLYFQDPTTKGLEAVDLFYMNVYYFFEPTTDVITAFPPGLRLVVGNPSLRTPPATGGVQNVDHSTGAIQPVQWVCPRSNTNSPLYPTNSDGLHGVGIQDPGNAGAGVGFPDQNCDGYASPLRADVYFPSCWNNATDPSLVTTDNPEGYKYLDTYNNKAAIDWTTNGNCPTGWAHIPQLFYEVYWNTPVFASRWTQGQGNQPFVLSNGDPTGYSLHGDFVAGWDTDVLTNVINNCDAGDNGMDKCPNIGPLNPTSSSCNIANLVPENLGSKGAVLTALPGNNPIGQWGVPVSGGVAPTGSTVAPAATGSGSSPVSSAPVSSAQASSPVATSKVGGVTGVVSSVASAPTTLQSVPASSVAAAQSSNTAPSAPSTTITSSSSSSNDTSIPSDWSYTGCYGDTTARVLNGITLADVGQHAVTNTKCIAYCEARSYSMAGTEFGGQCFCGNALTQVTKLDDSKCAMPCEGDATQTCGGGMALTLYSKSGTAVPKLVRSLGRLRRHITGGADFA